MSANSTGPESTTPLSNTKVTPTKAACQDSCRILPYPIDWKSICRRVEFLLNLKEPDSGWYLYRGSPDALDGAIQEELAAGRHRLEDLDVRHFLEQLPVTREATVEVGALRDAIGEVCGPVYTADVERSAQELGILDYQTGKIRVYWPAVRSVQKTRRRYRGSIFVPGRFRTTCSDPC